MDSRLPPKKNLEGAWLRPELYFAGHVAHHSTGDGTHCILYADVGRRDRLPSLFPGRDRICSRYTNPILSATCVV